MNWDMGESVESEMVSLRMGENGVVSDGTLFRRHTCDISADLDRTGGASKGGVSDSKDHASTSTVSNSSAASLASGLAIEKPHVIIAEYHAPPDEGAIHAYRQAIRTLLSGW